jgi:hypothetical protein
MMSTCRHHDSLINEDDGMMTGDSFVSMITTRRHHVGTGVEVRRPNDDKYQRRIGDVVVNLERGRTMMSTCRHHDSLINEDDGIMTYRS